jgi:N-methylhydantoinase B/oxoprolinase/acetone carboxylase alpha subunit
VEIFETRYPLLVETFRLVTDSGGPGRHRGGLGTERVLEVLAPEMTVSALFDRAKIPPWGLAGGGPGGLAGIAIRQAGDTEYRSFSDVFGTVSPSKFSNVTVRAGDRIRLVSAGGGGYGDPRRRPREDVLRDVRNRYVSERSARKDYGVDPADGSGVRGSHPGKA